MEVRFFSTNGSFNQIEVDPTQSQGVNGIIVGNGSSLTRAKNRTAFSINRDLNSLELIWFPYDNQAQSLSNDEPLFYLEVAAQTNISNITDSLINLELETTNNLLDPLSIYCTIPNLLRKGQNDWQINCSSDFNIRHWVLYNAQGQPVTTRPVGHMNTALLLARHEQLSLSAGIYFYRIEYEWEGRVNYSTGKIVLVE